jgi:RNase adapter protein RapZ
MSEILVITGRSGAGRSQAADDLEDLGWFVVDNLPSALIEKIAELGRQPGSTIQKLALVVGSGEHQSDIVDVVQQLRASGDRVRILFLDASDNELVKRYGATRRRHPLSEVAGGVLEAVQLEQTRLEALKADADFVIDTTNLNVHQLKAAINERFNSTGEDDSAMRIAIVSFGFKHGLPVDVDLVFDVRFLPNPFWLEELRPHSGLNPDVRAYVLGNELAEPFLSRLEDLLLMLLPAYAAEGKSYLTVAIGCTGGRHRSVAISEELGRRLAGGGYAPVVQHRDMNREGKAR